MSTFTPGPWFYRKGDEWSHSVVTHHGTLPDGSPNCWTVASINTQRQPEHEANARLIAAAPELLGACEMFMRFIPHSEIKGEPESLLETMRSAIAKATGGQS